MVKHSGDSGERLKNNNKNRDRCKLKEKKSNKKDIYCGGEEAFLLFVLMLLSSLFHIRKTCASERLCSPTRGVEASRRCVFSNVTPAAIVPGRAEFTE